MSFDILYSLLSEISFHESVSRGITKYTPPISQTVPVKPTEIKILKARYLLARSEKNESTRSKLWNGLNRAGTRNAKGQVDGLNVPMERVSLQSLCQS